MPNSLTYARGLVRNPHSVQADLLATKPHPRASRGAPLLPWVIQPLRRVINQGQTTRCAAATVASVVEAARGYSDPYVDLSDLYRECLRLDGTLATPDAGTYPATAARVLIERGYVLRAGNDVVLSTDQQVETADDALDAADLETPTTTHQAIDPADSAAVAQVCSDLVADVGVATGGGTTSVLDRYRGVPDGAPIDDVPLGTEALGGDDGGHALRILGYWVHPTHGLLFLYVNSWGVAWGGCHRPDGTWLPGCFWGTADTLGTRWNVDALRIR